MANRSTIDWTRLGGSLAVAVAVATGGCSSADDAPADGEVVTADDGGNGGATDGEVTDGADASASIAACDVLGLDEVTAAGVPAVTGPTPNEDNPNFDECNFLDESGAGVLQVSVFPPSGQQGAIGDQEELDGIGAGAVYSEGLQVVNVELEDGTFVSFYLQDSSLDTRTVLVDLARRAFG